MILIIWLNLTNCFSTISYSRVCRSHTVPLSSKYGKVFGRKMHSMPPFRIRDGGALLGEVTAIFIALDVKSLMLRLSEISFTWNAPVSSGWYMEPDFLHLLESFAEIAGSFVMVAWWTRSLSEYLRFRSMDQLIDLTIQQFLSTANFYFLFNLFVNAVWLKGYIDVGDLFTSVCGAAVAVIIWRYLYYLTPRYKF